MSWIALTAMVLMAACPSAFAQSEPAQVRALAKGETIERELGRGETHVYTINLRSGEFFHARVEQRGGDVVVALFAPHGRKLVEVNSLKEGQGPKPLFWIAETTGKYQLQVRSQANDAAGHYDIRVLEVRRSTQLDKKRTEAQHAFVDATTLEGDENSEARRQQLEKFNQALVLWRETGEIERQLLTLKSIAGVYLALGEPQEALQHLQQALSLERQIGNRTGEGGILLLIAIVHDNLGDYQRALEYFAQVLSIAKAIGDRDGEATALSRIGFVYSSQGKQEQALEYFKQALPVLRGLEDREAEAITLSQMGILYSAMGDKKQALELFHQTLTIVRGLGNRAAEATTLNRIGGVYKDLSENETALTNYNQALLLLRTLGDRGNEANILNNIGSIFSALGEKRKALEFYTQALPGLREAGDRRGEASTLNNIGAIYSALGEKQRALEYYNQALPLRRAVADRSGEATTLTNIGSIYHDLGMKEKALEYYNQALPIHKATGGRSGEASTLNNIALVHDDLGQKEKALEYYEQALAIQRAMLNRRDEATTLSNIGKVYSDLNQNEKALQYHNQALPIRRAIGDRSGEAATLHNIGSVYQTTGEEKKALAYYNQALPILRAIGERSSEAVTLNNLMWLWKENNTQLAVFYGKQSINLYQQIRGNIKGLDREIQETFLKSVESGYRTLADLLIAQGRLPEAQQVLELLKEQEYFEFVRRDAESAALSGAQIKFSAAEAELEKQFSQIASQLAEIGSERGALLALDSRNADQEKRLSELDSKLESANQAFQKFLDQLEAELKKSKPEKNDMATLRETQALMDTLRELDAVALYTIVGRDKFRVILLTADIQKAYEYAITEAELNNKVYAFREVLQDPRMDPKRQAQELYRVLIGPELARDIAQTRIQTIMWSLDGTLRYLPVAALHDGQKYLVENYRNVVFTLASRDHLKDPVSPKWQALGVGVSREREVIDEESKVSLKFAALPGVQEELSGIVRQTADGAAKNGVLDGKVMLDELFTVEALKSSLRLRGGDQPYKLVHIASHFNFQPGDETNSFLLLGDGTLSLAKLKGMANLFSKVELLTLSACNTATGSAGEGKEVEGFAVLAQRQGAEAIIATLWPVSDPSTSQLMQQFYRLREAKVGTSKAEALREAQLALLHGELKVDAGNSHARAELAAAGSKDSRKPAFSTDRRRPFAHPYYWAPFILIGNWR